MRFVCKEFKSHNNTSNLHLAGTLMVTFKLISRCFPWISCRCFQIIPPYGGSMDDGPSRTYLSSRPTFKFPDIGYSGYCRVFQRYLVSLSLGSISVQNLISRMPFGTQISLAGLHSELAEIEISRKHSVRVNESSRNEST